MGVSKGSKMDLTFICQQAETALKTVKQIANRYLIERKYDKTYEELVREYKLRKLNVIPDPPVPFGYEVMDKVNNFYFNMMVCDKLIDIITENTETHKDEIEHGEEIPISDIINSLTEIKGEVNNTINEVKSLNTNILSINKVNFDVDMERRVRDFLVIKYIIEKLNEGYESLIVIEH